MALEREFRDGEIVDGTRYRVLRMIGVGGMGSVYEVEHLELGKRFVLKALLRELSRREDLVLRLRNEWRALGRLEHPNIVLVTDAGTSGRVPFYVMERLEGETLAQRMRRLRRMPVRDALDLAIEILDGLSAAHGIGVVHRDVKPRNIFLVRGGRTKVLDFGVAKVVDDPAIVTARGMAIGTPRYMSPEQAKGDPVDGRSDVYAVGLLIFEMIAGVVPFEDAKDSAQQIVAHMTRVAPRLSTMAMGVSPELDVALSSMLAKNPRERPATARAAAEMLRAVRARTARTAAGQALLAFQEADTTQVSLAGVDDTTRPESLAVGVRSGSPSGALSWLEQSTERLGPSGTVRSSAQSGVPTQAVSAAGPTRTAAVERSARGAAAANHDDRWSQQDTPPPVAPSRPPPAVSGGAASGAQGRGTLWIAVALVAVAALAGGVGLTRSRSQEPSAATLALPSAAPVPERSRPPRAPAKTEQAPPRAAKAKATATREREELAPKPAEAGPRAPEPMAKAPAALVPEPVAKGAAAAASESDAPEAPIEPPRRPKADRPASPEPASGLPASGL